MISKERMEVHYTCEIQCTFSMIIPYICQSQDMLKALDILKTAVHETLSLYCNSFHPGYKPKWSAKPECEESSNNVESLPKIKVCALHRVNEPELRK